MLSGKEMNECSFLLQFCGQLVSMTLLGFHEITLKGPNKKRGEINPK